MSSTTLQDGPPPDWERPDSTLLQLKLKEGLSMATLAQAIDKDCTAAAVKIYLEGFTDDTMKSTINKNINTAPVIFSAVSSATRTDSLSIIRTLLEHGADPTATLQVDGSSGVPLLAFTIILGAKKSWSNVVEVVKLLLAWGADPLVMPRSLWQPVVNPSYVDPDKIKKDNANLKTKWCTAEQYKELKDILHLTYRYLFYRASVAKKVPEREAQIATALGMSNLLQIPYYLVGQDVAAGMIKTRVLRHAVIKNTSKKNLVMAFVGPSGHGKSELARQMGRLLGLPIQMVDMAQKKSTIDIVGATASYKNAEQGTQLNNFLHQHDGQRAVVFLDEFDKTTKNVRDALLILFGSGIYNDRRTDEAIDCSQIIWILATNLGETKIADFYNTHLKNKSEIDKDCAPMELLKNTLKDSFRESWGAPIVGRIDSMIPFTPFSADEQAIVVHKYYLELQNQLLKQIDKTSDDPNLVGRIKLDIINDGMVCQSIARKYYVPELGARSIIGGISESIEEKAFGEYLSIPAAISESANDEDLLRFKVLLEPTDNGTEVVVRRPESQPSFSSPSGSEDKGQYLQQVHVAEIRDGVPQVYEKAKVVTFNAPSSVTPETE
ncbi:MAG: hypothetical protein M1820_002816 [Bogoriella megaspora]|nr:MAG: hypothetical protein M1820_002816 [Bogoriella megaspora]